MSSADLFAGTVPANYHASLGPVLFEPYAVDLVRRIKNNPLKNVLELACGTGRLTAHLSPLIPAGGQLISTDVSAAMIGVAKAIVKNDKLKWEVVNAQELPFSNQSFDHVFCQFGVMFFQDKVKAFQEALRVLKPKGKFIFSVWDEIKYNPHMLIIKQMLEHIYKEEAPSFFDKGPFSFFDKILIKKLLLEAGFQRVKITVVKKKAFPINTSDFVTGSVDGSPLSAFLNTKPEASGIAFRQKLKEALATHFIQQGLQLRMQALLIEAAK